MDNPTALLCYKCGNPLDYDTKHVTGTCSECDTIVTLPLVCHLGSERPQEAIINTLNRLNLAAKYQSEYVFHYAFNTYEKVIKSQRSHDLCDYYPYWGKALAQYGVVYRYNKKLELVPICMRTNLSSFTTNENFIRAMEYADVETQSLLKKEVLAIESNHRELLANLVNFRPIDLEIVVDDSNQNENAQKDVDLAREVEKIADELKISYRTTFGDFIFPNIDKWHLDAASSLETTDLMVIISSDPHHLSNQLFKNVWMIFQKDNRIRDSINKRLIFLTDIKQLNLLEEDGKFEISPEQILSTDSDWLGAMKAKINKNFTYITSLNSQEVNEEITHPKIEQLLQEQKFDEAKSEIALAMETGKDYSLYRYSFLAKKRCSSEVDIITKIIDARKDANYQTFYLLAPRSIKRKYYKYLELFFEKVETLEEIDEEYEKEVSKFQKKICYGRILNLAKYLLSTIIFSIICFMTVSLASLGSLLIFFLGLILVFGLSGRMYLRNIMMGKLPEALKTEIDVKKYYHKIRKLLTPSQGADLLLNPYLKKMKLVCHLAFGLCVSIVLAFVIKEIVIRANYSNINYYYVFNNVVVTGGNGKNITIPSKIYNREVTSVKANAFEGNKIVEKVFISFGINEIGSGAFKDCPNLLDVTLPVSLRKVGDIPPFLGCIALTNFVLSPQIFQSSSRIDDIGQLLGDDYLSAMPNISISYTN